MVKLCTPSYLTSMPLTSCRFHPKLALIIIGRLPVVVHLLDSPWIRWLRSVSPSVSLALLPSEAMAFYLHFYTLARWLHNLYTHHTCQPAHAQLKCDRSTCIQNSYTNAIWLRCTVSWLALALRCLAVIKSEGKELGKDTAVSITTLLAQWKETINPYWNLTLSVNVLLACFSSEALWFDKAAVYCWHLSRACIHRTTGDTEDWIFPHF